MKKILSTILLFAIVITCFAGCAEENSAVSEADPRIEIAEKLLKATFTADTVLVEDCVPFTLWGFYIPAVRDLGWDFVEDVDVTLSNCHKLDEDEISTLQRRYETTAGVYLNIEDAYEYSYEILAHWIEDNGEADSEDERGEVTAAQIDGVWYAIFSKPNTIS